MKFILSKDGDHAVRSERIEEIYLDPEETRGLFGKRIECVTVEVACIDSDTSITMAKFDSDNTEENYKAAKKYLAELVDKLNGGTK